MVGCGWMDGWVDDGQIDSWINEEMKRWIFKCWLHTTLPVIP